MLKTINEIPTVNVSEVAPVNKDETSEEDPLQSEEGSSSSLRSGESGIDMTDGIFSFGKKNNRKSSSGGTGMENGSQSPAAGMENVKTSTPRDPKSKSKLDFVQSPREREALTRSAEWSHCE